MAGAAADAVKGQRIYFQRIHCVVAVSEVVCVEPAERGMAGSAFVFKSFLMVWVHGHFVRHLGSPEGVFGTVGHHGAAPGVCRIDIDALRSQVGVEELVRPMAASALSTAGEHRVAAERQLVVHHFFEHSLLIWRMVGLGAGDIQR